MEIGLISDRLEGKLLIESTETGNSEMSMNNVEKIRGKWARGELCLCSERWEQALVHFGDCDRSEPNFGGNNPSMIAWREGAALAHLRLGDRTTARELAADAVERAQRFGAPRAHGLALRAAALVEEGPADDIFNKPKADYTKALLAAAFDLTVVHRTAMAT